MKAKRNQMRVCYCCAKSIEPRADSHVSLALTVRECGGGGYLERSFEPWRLCADCWAKVDGFVAGLIETSAIEVTP